MNAILDRRTFLALSFVLLVAPVRAARTDGDDPATSDPRFRQATDLMIRGVRFERAAELLRTVAADFSESRQARLALACACVSRIASLSYAARYAEALMRDRTTYPERLRQWATKPRDPEDDDPPPAPPIPPPDIVILIKDDKTPYRLTHDALIVKVGALRSEALAQLDAAAKSARVPAERAEAAYFRGWCLRVLARYGESSDLNTAEDPEEAAPGPPLFPLPDGREMLTCFREATEAAPNQAAYWRALGDTLGQVAEAADAYRKSLESDPRQAVLWYKLYSDEMTKSVPQDEGDADAPPKPRRVYSPRDAAHYLEKAAWADPGNAFYLYEQANLALKETRFEAYTNSTTRDLEREALRPARIRNAGSDAISKTERANNAKTLEFPFYRETPPRWLAVAWDYATWLSLTAPWYARLRALARGLSGYAGFMATEFHDADAVNRSCRAALGLGKRLIGDGSLPPVGDKDFVVLTRLVGIAIAAMVFKAWQTALTVCGLSEQVRGVEREEEAFRTWSAEFRKQIRDSISAEHFTAHY